MINHPCPPRDEKLPSLLRQAFLVLVVVAAIHVAVLLSSCAGTFPIAVGLEYRIKDTPVTLVVTPSTKGGYDWKFRTDEGQIADWLVKNPDGSYTITTKDGTAIKVTRDANNRPIITILATGEKAPVKVVPVQETEDPQPATPIPAK